MATTIGFHLTGPSLQSYFSFYVMLFYLSIVNEQ